MANEYAVELSNISVRFPDTLANDNVSLQVKKGEILAIVGENGAGKSTLMNVLYGLLEPTGGEVSVYGEKMTTFSPSNSIKMGIGMVHQHFMLVPSFTVAQNIVLCREPRRFGLFFDNKQAVKITENLVKEYGLTVDPNAKVMDLSVGLLQRVEILKTLSRGSKILILDEPTAVLTPQETTELFAAIRKIASDGDRTVIIITHKLYEVMEISDRVAVMRGGKLIDVKNTSDVTEQSLANMMIGRDFLFEQLPKTKTTEKETAIEVSGVTATGNRGLVAINDVTFNVKRGEIVGIAGVDGNGQDELAEVITGLRKCNKGKITINGKDITELSPGQIRDAGLAHVPPDRLLTGLSKNSSVSDNLIAGKERSKAFSAHSIDIKAKPIREYAEKLKKTFDIRTSGVSAKISSLSGGNMQKVVIGREFSFENANVLIVSQPTRGVDIGAMEFIHDHIIKKRNEGCSILLISADLDEIFRLSDRILTMFEGEITGEFFTDVASKTEVGAAMLSKHQLKA